ncbi:hypothetical protein TCAL_13355, partial [Tigriopus californicus]
CNPHEKGSAEQSLNLYDPLDLCAPVTVAGNIQMKELVIQGKGWNETVDQDHDDKQCFSLRDQYALDMIQSNIKKLPNGKGYEVGLPWFPGLDKPKNNRIMAEKRFFGLEKRFGRDPKFHLAYINTIHATLENGRYQGAGTPMEYIARLNSIQGQHQDQGGVHQERTPEQACRPIRPTRPHLSSYNLTQNKNERTTLNPPRKKVGKNVHLFTPPCVPRVEHPEATLQDIIMQGQEETFPEELKALMGGRMLSKSCRLLELSPFTDPLGLLRAHGRLSRAQLGYDQRFPVILCPKHPLTKLIVEESHWRRHHPGVNHGLRLLRQEYWVLRGRQTVLCEVMGMLNSRPLTYESSDPGDCRALTPNHFLLQRSNSSVPPGEYASLNTRDHSRYVQAIVDKGPEFLRKESNLWPSEHRIGTNEEEKREKFKEAISNAALLGEGADLLDTMVEELGSEDEDSFQKNSEALTRSYPLPKTSRMKDLSLFIDARGVMRAKGWLSRAQLDSNQKHPIIL